MFGKELVEELTNRSSESITTDETLSSNFSSVNQQVEEIQYATPVCSNSSITSSLKPECITFDVMLVSPNYDDVYDFIKEVERLDRIVRLDKVNFSVPNGKADSNGIKETIQTTLQLTTFYCRDKSY
ncbi:type 4a pilus biogenesis protein PilO [Viridibacillus arvi]|uniref:type 4a pilus biogenesis protein PilO n=1 Tax=Viridibacillus arvi TaxID=263475 RepID=UPI0036A50AF4